MGVIFLLNSPIQAEIYIYCPDGDLIKFEQDKNNVANWDASAEFDKVKFAGSFIGSPLKKTVTPIPEKLGTPVQSEKNVVSCIYRLANDRNTALVLTASEQCKIIDPIHQFFSCAIMR